MDTLKPCCQPAALQDGHVRHHEHICFIFGQGLCQPLLAIPRLNLYVSLVRQLNSTNYMELRRSYRQKLDNSTTAERTDLDLLLLVPSPMKPIAITALRDRGRIILSPEQRADWSQPKPQTPTTTTYRPSNYNEA
ncbi:cysteine motif protein 8 [Diadegma fenestrale ichnovirus]|nr:cysteine motif protein 8 [Diadegma fenestrale ichnovirus]